MPTTTRRWSFYRVVFATGLLLVLLLAMAWPVYVRPIQAQQPVEQMRAFWVDSQHPGYRNPAELDTLINDVVRANANTIIAQMRWRGDARYNQSIEPRAVDPKLATAETFDPLAALLEQAHARGIAVHAWVNVSVTCKDGHALQGHPQHVCTTHGPAVSDPERWTTATYQGAQVGDLDFGHPQAVAHMEAVVFHMLRHYPALDGVHFDYMRYGFTDYGYNRVSLDRFNRAYGHSADYRPQPEDPTWSQWRRDRMTELMRRLYIGSKAINPAIQVSVATITWGGSGTANRNDWTNSAAYARVFQDWRGWLDEGIIDFAVPMHYFEEHDPQERAWYDNWLAWDRQNAGRRAIVAGVGVFLNSPDNGIAQVQRALAADAEGRGVAGVAFFSYYVPSPNSTDAGRQAFMDRLKASVFAEPARVPVWPWIANPTSGHIQGIATIDGQIVPAARITLLQNASPVRDLTAASDGWYGAVDLPPGSYTVVIQAGDNRTAQHTTTVHAGTVTELHTAAPGALLISPDLQGYWEQNGGLAVFGFPITAQHSELVEGQARQVQWFERNRLELHPENAAPYNVLLGRLSEERLLQLGRVWQYEARAAGPQPGCIWFEQTGHNVCNQAPGLGFKSYWENHGLRDPRLDPYAQSLALFGLPLSEPQMETNTSGDTVLTQWFERARFEWHPHNPDQYKVLLGLLGNETN